MNNYELASLLIETANKILNEDTTQEDIEQTKNSIMKRHEKANDYIKAMREKINRNNEEINRNKLFDNENRVAKERRDNKINRQIDRQQERDSLELDKLLDDLR